VLIVFDQVLGTLPDPKCLAPVTLALGECYENNQPALTSCNQRSTPYFANIKRSCSCIRFLQHAGAGNLQLTGRFVAYNGQNLKFTKDTQKDRQKNRQKNKQTEKQTDRQTGRQKINKYNQI
jgi:hypothetical protein